ncbi:hypothetical protein BCR33DRAFT_26572 [Rhizoclosmatium globosum]|uniref:Uncharacterized protein n=1 Tax=Rhizoclosmatium globosum TaxID=329046 RepID=A0A1Y2AXG6_9FUNG|nr:hypothetical protein BCR33DRAFT_26572 [Rhizoclosmatium globosum]|eukprot:ORY27283.1 hypothetical protein BCR33DRAFT_26572 [Rhizoclosmatium globosum]
MTDHGIEVDDIGSVDVGVAAGEKKTKNKKKRKTKKIVVACVEDAKVDVAPEKVDAVLELKSSSETQAVDVDAVNIPNMDVALTEVQYSVSRSESRAESMYGTVVLDQDEDTISDIQRILIHCLSIRGLN